jgi:hypothetical protein
MNVKELSEIPPWEWPDGAEEVLLEVLRGDRASVSDRLLAAELAAQLNVINDEVAGTLLAVLRRGDEPVDLRGQAAISLGPVLEQAAIDGFEDPDDVPISERMFRTIQESLRKLYTDAEVPTAVRRRVLEAAVRAPQGWQRDAIRAAYASGDEAWTLTAVFCMRFIRGFDEQILQALDSANPDIHHEAVCAAGNWGIDAAYRHVVALVVSRDTEKRLLLAAIEAVGNIRPGEAASVLDDLADSDDEDIADAVSEALTMAGGLSRLDAEDDEE